MLGPLEKTGLTKSRGHTFRQLTVQRDGGKITLGLGTPMRVSFQFLSEYRAGQDRMRDALARLVGIRFVGQHTTTLILR